MAVNYSDDRLVAVENAENKATTEINKTYNDMIEQSDKVYQSQIDASKNWADKQSALQQQQTDFAIEKIEQEKAQSEKDYLKEQSGAYVDWQKQSNKYGANAEAMASQGLTHSGYSESSQVSMYNTYQIRLATARESHEQAKLNFANMIKDAQLQNSSALAEIALKSYEQQAQLSIQMVTNRNQLLAEKINAKQQTHQIYRQQYQDVLDQINKERQEAIQKKQFEREMALAEQRFQEEKRQAQVQEALAREQFEYTKAKASASSSGGSSGSSSSASISGNKTNSSSSNKTNNSSSSNKTNSNNPSNVKSTGLKVSNVLSKSQASLLGLNTSAELVTSNGKYYAKEGNNYIDLTPVQAIISTNKKLVGSVSSVKG